MEHRIDVSDLAPPEPLEHILDALADLPPGDWLRVHHRRDPHPLYPMLRNMDYCWTTIYRATGDLDILIWPTDMEPPPDAAGASPPLC